MISIESSAFTFLRENKSVQVSGGYKIDFGGMTFARAAWDSVPCIIKIWTRFDLKFAFQQPAFKLLYKSASSKDAGLGVPTFTVAKRHQAKAMFQRRVFHPLAPLPIVRPRHRFIYRIFCWHYCTVAVRRPTDVSAGLRKPFQLDVILGLACKRRFEIERRGLD